MTGRPYSATDLRSPLVRRLGERVAVEQGDALVVGRLANVHEDGTVTIVDGREIVAAVEPAERVYAADLGDAERLADEMWGLIGDDLSDGLVPAEVASFTDLHDHVDANEYAMQAQGNLEPPLADRSWDDVLEVYNLATRLVDVRLAAGEHRP